MDQFQITHNPFIPRQQTQQGATTVDGTTTDMGDLNPYNVGVVHELVKRDKADVAEAQFPYEYKTLYGNRASEEQQQPTGTVKIYNRSTDTYTDLNLGVEQAKKYNPNDWQNGEKRFDMNALQGDLTDEDRQYAEKVLKRVDYSQIGGINGSNSNKAYRLFDNGAVLSNLYAKYLGMRPEEVLALNHYDRKEVSENLLSKYYDRTSAAEKQLMGEKGQWINTILKHYGMGDGDETGDGLGTMMGNLVEGTWEGVKDQFSNYGESIKTFLGFNSEGMSKEEIAAEKARRQAREQNRTQSEKALLQRFDSLMEDGRYLDAAQLAATNPDMYGALMGTTIGGLITDAGIAAGITWGAAATATALSGGTAAPVAGAAATAATAANVARFAGALAKLAKSGTYVGVSGLGMHGALAKEIMLDGNTIPVGSEIYNTLAVYGLIGATIPVVTGGTLEHTIARRILSSKAGKGLSEEAANTIASKAVKAIKDKGYKYSDKGFERSMLRGGVEWGGKVLYRGAMEPGTEYLQEGVGEAIKQSANQDGTIDTSKIDGEKVHKAGMRAAVIAAPLGAANTAVTTGIDYVGRGEEVSRANTAYEAQQKELAKENAYKEWKNAIPQEELAKIRSDIDFEMYDADGNRVEPTDDYRHPKFKNTKEKQKFYDELEEKILRKRYAEEQSPQQPEQQVETEQTDQPTIQLQDPFNFEVPNGPYVDDELVIAQDLNNSDMGYFHVPVSPVKDLRQYDTATNAVDKMWTDVRNDIDTWRNGVDRQVTELRKKIDDINKKDLDKFPQQLRDKYAAEMMKHQEDILRLETTKQQLEQVVREARDLDGVQRVFQLAENTDGVIHTAKARKAVNAIRERADLATMQGHIAYHRDVADNATRFSVADRLRTQEELGRVAQMAGVPVVSTVATDLNTTIQTYREAINKSRYANTPRARRALYKLNAIEKAVKHNRPEMLDNLSAVDGKLSKVDGVKSDKFTKSQSSAVLGGHKRYLDETFTTAKNKGTGTSKVSSLDPDLRKQVNDMLKDYQYHPLETVEDIHSLISDYHNMLVRTNDQSNVEQRASLLGVLGNLNDIISDLKSDQDVVRTPQSAATRRYIKMGDNRIYDPVLRDMSGTELAEYVQNVKDISKAFGVTGIAPPLESNVADHVANLRQHLASANDGLGAPIVYNKKDQFVARVLVDGHDNFRYAKELASAVNTYLQGVENRIRSYERRQNDPDAPLADAFTLENVPYGDLMRAVIDDTNNQNSTEIRDWVKKQKDLYEQVLTPTDGKVEASVTSANDNTVGAIADELLEPTPPQMSDSTELALVAGVDYTPTRGVTEFDRAGFGKPSVLNPTHHGQRKLTDGFGAPLPKAEREAARAHNRARASRREQGRDQFVNPLREPSTKAEYYANEERAFEERSQEYSAEQRAADEARHRRYENAMRVHGHLKDGLVSLGVNGSGGFIPKYNAMANIYNDAVAEVGNDSAAVAEYVRNAMNDIAERNPNAFSEKAIATITTTIADVNNIQAWMDSQEKASNAVKASISRHLYGEMNNNLLVNALEGGPVMLDSLTDLVGNMALWYQSRGYTNVAGLLSVVLDSKQFSGVDTSSQFSVRTKANGHRFVARQRGVAANTAVHLVDGAEFHRLTGLDPTTTQGAYSHKRDNGQTVESVIYINRDGNHDIAATLAHELGHVAWAELFGNNGWTVGNLLRDTDIKNLESFLNKRVHTEQEQAYIADLKENGIIVPKADDQTKYELAPHGLEELIMHGLDSLMEQRSGQAGVNAYSVALSKLFGKNDIDSVLDLLARRATRNANAVPRTKPQHSPVLDGFSEATLKSRKGRAKKDPFKKSPNEDNPSDMTTVYHFGFHEDNQNVSADPMAWWDNNAWNLFYVDANGNPVRTTGLSASEMVQMAQDLDLYIEQREKNIILEGESKRVDQFLHFSPPVARMWKGINRLFGGDDFNVSPIVRRIMSFSQKWAIEQHGADQFYKMFENVLTHVTGTDKEGVLTTRINEIRTRINHQLNNPGVGDKLTMHELTNELIGFINEIGWSEQKVNDVLYSLRAGDYFTRLHERQKHDPKWKNKPFNPNNSTGFSFIDENGKEVQDPTGEIYWSRLSDKDKELANSLRELVINLNNAVIQIEFDSGRINQEQYDDQYGRFYVPLKNDTDRATAFQRTAVGRHTKADRPLVHLIANHKARMHAVEQTMIYQAFMDLMQQYPIKGFATFNSSSLKNKGDGEYAMEADGFIDGTAVTFYRDGQKINMTITHPAMAAAIKKRKGQATSAYLDAITRATGLMGLTRTALPTFAKTAFFRDMGMAFFNVQAAFRGKEKGMNDFEWLALGSRTARDMARYLPMIAKARMDMSKADWRYKVYRSEGGIGNVTGYDIESVNAALERDIFKRGSVKSKAKRLGRGYLDVLHASDDAARFALWMNYLEKKHGRKFTSEAELLTFLESNKDIANIARDASKNITGNFEQRGVARGLRSHFIFWNAIQAGMRNIYGLVNPRYGTYGIKGLAALMSYIMMAGSDEGDEDGKSKESRMKGLGNNLQLGDFQVNLAQELRPFSHLAEALKFYFRGDWDMSKAVNHYANGLAQAVVPWQMAETGDTLTDAAYALTPTMLQPLVLSVAGKNYFGGDSAPVPYDTDGKKWEDAPDAFRATSGTTDMATNIAQAMYHYTGGSVDIAPGTLDMFAQQFGGSIFSIAKDISKRVTKGDNILDAGLSQFTKGHTREYNDFALRDEVNDRFKEAMRKHKISEDGLILGKSELSDEATELNELFKAMGKEIKSITGEDGESKMTDLYTQLDKVKASGDPSPDEFLRITSQIEQLRQTRNVIYGKYNRILLDMGY